MMGNKCKKCGYSDKRALQIDHKFGGGRKERKNSGHSMKYYRKVLKKIKEGSKEYQLLCANCNVIKRVENFEN